MKHLENTTYIKHLLFAFKVSVMLFVVSVVGIIHGIFPFILKNYVSSRVHDLNGEFTTD